MTIANKSIEQNFASSMMHGEPNNTYNWESQHLAMRSNLLSGCDWTQVADSPLSDEKKAQWAEYRQKLRDLTKQENWPNAPEWPLPPID